MRIETNAKDRKKLAKAIEEFTGGKNRYLGPPSFSYEVGNYIIDRSGTITSETETGEAELRSYLEKCGFVEKKIEYLEISIPLLDMDADAMKRLVFMIHSKQYLLNKVVGAPCFAINENLVAELENSPPENKTEFFACYAKYESKGLAFNDEKVTLTFASSTNADKNQAFLYLAPIMVSKAKEAKRISPKENKPENEKYYFRMWLIQLGLGGNEAKGYRKTLMENLKGYSAFRTEADAEKFKSAQKEKRAAKKLREKTSENKEGESV